MILIINHIKLGGIVLSEVDTFELLKDRDLYEICLGDGRTIHYSKDEVTGIFIYNNKGGN